MMRWSRGRGAAAMLLGGMALVGVLAAGPVPPMGDAGEPVEVVGASGADTTAAAAARVAAVAVKPGQAEPQAFGGVPEPSDAEVATEAVPVSDRGTEAVLETLHGSASYYADALAGRRTASGVPYRPGSLVAAHRTLPFGTRLQVENVANGRTVEVEVVDRGPFAKGRVLDLSRRAAEELGFIRQGHARVRIHVLDYGDG